MTTAVDTNVIVSFWDSNDSLSSAMTAALYSARLRGPVVVAAAVYAELLASPGRNEAFLDYFFRETGVAVDWNLDESVWRLAGRAFQSHLLRRKPQIRSGPRRILADFVIGAHALRRGYALLTLDDEIYRACFPLLPLVDI
jgi:predicted nucleic acid-binding protein